MSIGKLYDNLRGAFADFHAAMAPLTPAEYGALLYGGAPGEAVEVPAGVPIPEFAASLRGLQSKLDAEAYAGLRAVLDEAFDQASKGKGKQRHANGRPFERQPSMETTRIVGLGYPLGQAMKKAGEASGMAQRGDTEAAARECLGAIVFLAMAVIALREEKQSG